MNRPSQSPAREPIQALAQSHVQPDDQAATRVALLVSECEPVWATPSSYSHLRIVTDQVLRPGGGIVGTSLCGADMNRGWDIPVAVDAAHVAKLSTRDSDGRAHLCPGCAAAYRDLPTN